MDIFGVEYAAYEIKELAVNDNQLAVITWPDTGNNYVMKIFQLDSLLSESSDQEISHRTFEFDQNYTGLYSLDLHKSSISLVVEALVEEGEAAPPEGSMAALRPREGRKIPVVKLITFDFWNCET